MHLMRGLILALLLCPVVFAARNLEIYFVDVEGGQATLIVSPSGESLLVDAGWSNHNYRDALRILAAAKSARIKKIDYLLVTHYHEDHVGGVPNLVSKIPVGTFLDHGPNTETDKNARRLSDAYAKAIGGAPHKVVKPGDTIPLKGLEIKVLVGRGNRIQTPLMGAGQSNALCGQDPKRSADPSENARSVGFLLSFGSFRFLDLGDLTWNHELELACPVNKIGTVDVYLSTHHGANLSGPATLVHALRPRVAIMNNGARKGGSPEAWQTIRNSPGLIDLWQLHFAIAGGKQTNSPDPFIANLEESCAGYAIKLSALPTGAFSVLNTRNRYEKQYPARQ
jgi:beta-lactamase superfamily II metal-dependent hydrolase